MRNLTKSAAFIGGILALTSSGANAQSIGLPGTALYPESIAYSPKTGVMYVTGSGDGSVQTFDPNHTERGTKVLQPAGTDGRKSALGVKVDDQRERLFVVDGASVYVYGLESNELIRKIDASTVIGDAKTFLNDIAFDAQGNAYITDSFNSVLYKVDSLTLSLTVFRDLSKVIPYGNQNGMPYNLNGVVLTKDQSALLAVKTNDGSLWRISLVSDEIKEVRLSEPLMTGDALVWGPNEMLYVARNFENLVSKVDFSEERDVYPVTSVTTSDVNVPTGVAIFEGEKTELFILNSQWGSKSPSPFTLTEIEVK